MFDLLQVLLSFYHYNLEYASNLASIEDISLIPTIFSHISQKNTIYWILLIIFYHILYLMQNSENKNRAISRSATTFI